MSAAYPTVYSALLTTVESALSGTVRVVDGFDLSSDSGDVVQIGVPNIADERAIAAGSFTQETITFSKLAAARKETGSINGLAFAWNGQGDADAARTEAFNYIGLIDAALRTDPTLGITSISDVVARFASGDIAEDRVDGASVAVSFVVSYTATL